MWKAEEDFPRGGGQKEKRQTEIIQTESTDEEKLKGKRPKKNETTKKLKRKINETQKSSSTESKKLKKEKFERIVDTPLSQCLAKEICVLGCVRDCFEYYVSLSLPGNRVASLPITEISPAYTKQLQKLAEMTNVEEMENVKPIDEMFKPGMLISVVVDSVQENKAQTKTQIKLSCAPSKINSSLPLSSIDGMLLFGNVLSVEDHGYRIDVGIKGLQAFLTLKDAEKMIKSSFAGNALNVGQPVWCVARVKGKSDLKAGESRTVNVSIDPDVVKEALFKETTNLNSVLPGLKVTAKIEKKVDSGLFVKVHNFDAVIHGSQLPKSALKYKVKSEVNARVLYVNPVTKVIHLTALPNIVNFDGSCDDLFQDMKKGEIFDAQISRVEKNKGLYFRLPNGVTAFATLKKISDKSDKPDISSYEIGQTHKCRVLGFNYMEGLALITLKESVISQKFLTVDDITVGEVVEGTVKEVFFNGVSVNLSKGIKSFIPGWHLADVPIKQPEKKFEPGQKLQCRVVKIDVTKSRVMLTHKKSLLKTKLPIVSDYSQLMPYMEMEGVIITIKERVVIVALFGNVKGYVTLNDMSTEKVEDPSDLFYVGQVIRCRVVYFNADEQKLKLSFNFGTQKKEKKSIENAVPTQSPFEFGKITAATVTKRCKEGFFLSILPGKGTAYLPFRHLSDYREIQELRKLSFKPKTHIKELTYFNHNKNTIMTMKESFIEAAHQHQLLENFSDLQSGQLVPAAIKNHEDYGIFLELAAGFTGLCPAKTLTNLQPTSLSDLFHPGQSVITRLTKIDSEKKRFLGSLRVDECYEGGLETPMSLLKNYLAARKTEMEKLLTEEENFSCYSNLNIGEIVEVTVSSVLKKGILGELQSGAKALSTKQHFGGLTPEEGKTYEAVVLFVDLLTPCVELSIEPKLVKGVKKRKENTKTQLKPEQVLKADVVLVKPEFLLMSLRGHGTGKFVFAPTKKHMNDVEISPMYRIGTFTDVVLKETFAGEQLASLLMHDPVAKAKEEEENILKKQSKHSTQPGTLLEARVRSVHPLQLNIIAGDLHGRVHISEAVDDPKKGENPVRRYHPEQEIKVRVIGLRDVKSQSYLPITKVKANRTLLECTLKPSKMECNISDLMVEKLDLNPGDHIWVYVIKVSEDRVWVQAGLTQQGYIQLFNLSEDMEVVNSPGTHFCPGQAVSATVLHSHVADKNKMEFSLIDVDKDVLEIGDHVTAQITSIKPNECLNLRLPKGRRGTMLTKSTNLYHLGKFIRCEIKNKEADLFNLDLVDGSSDLGITKKSRKRKTPVDDQKEQLLKKPKKLKKKQKLKQKMMKNEESEESDIETSDSAEEEVNTSETAAKENVEPLRMELPKFSWDGELKNEALGQTNNDDDDDDDDDDDNVAPERVKSKKKKKRDEEKLIQELERSQRSGGIVDPTSVEDYERLVLQSPHSSLVWLRYMAHHLELAELERARSVAERALTTISFREEQEKENVWLAYLNMEITYGDESDVKKLLERAVQYCEPLNIYVKMSDMYIAAEKAEEAEQLFITMTRKFKKEKSVWKSYAQFLFKANRIQSARNLLQRCITVLEKKDHVEVITRFTILEFNHGDAERGRTMFENLIASYPGRTDLWSVYVDMVVKVGDIDGARHLLERAIKLKLNSKKLSFFLQKFMKFEETHGTEEKLQHVKDLAVELLES